MISVIVPIYNKEQYLQRTINSILQQTYAEFELIAVDDGSTDGCADLLAQCTDPRLRIIRQENMGPGAARNRGVAEARGEYLAFLDADDEWNPRYLEHMHDLFLRTNVSWVSSLRTGQSGKLLDFYGLYEGVHRVTTATPPALINHYVLFCSFCMSVVRRDDVLSCGGFFDRDHCTYGEDTFLLAKLLMQKPFYLDHTPMVTVHTEASSLSFRPDASYPIEPLFLYSEEVAAICPPDLRETFMNFVKFRAKLRAKELQDQKDWKNAIYLMDKFWPGLL